MERVKSMRVKLSRRGRWAVPATAVAVTGAVIAGLQIPAAQATPALPARTPAQLLAQVDTNAKVPPLTGTVVETTSLGLPQLPKVGDPTSLSSLITGSHTLKVYYENARHYRLAVPQSLSESDIIRDGSKLWLWDSTSNTVTEYVLPKDALKHAKAKLPPMPALTPQQAANEVLAAVGKTTLVTVQSNVLVAGEPAYQLVLAPKDSRSLVGQVVIAVDGKYGVPLRVQVFAKNATAPAFQVGYTDISFVTPAQANLQFTAPPGAKVTVHNLTSGDVPSAHQRSGSGPDNGYSGYGSGWLTVIELPQSALDMPFSAAEGAVGGRGFGRPTAVAVPRGGAPTGMAAIGGDSAAVFHALMIAARPVHGSWGSGTLLTTSLMSMLITNGEVYIGAVKPSVLYDAVGHTH
jgi:outer membrane lipoprotein-sorting protein